MSYTPTQWQTGDTITAEKLNHMEDGIAAAASGGGSSNVLIVHGTIDPSGEGQEFPMTIDKTADEIVAAEYSVLIVDVGPGESYELPEVTRYQVEGTLAVTWGTQMGGQEFMGAFFSNQGYFQMAESESPIVTIHPTLGTRNEGVYPVTAIDETYEKIYNADMAYAKVFTPDSLATFKLPFVIEQTTPNYAQLIFGASVAQSNAALTLSFSVSTHEFDASASSFTVVGV